MSTHHQDIRALFYSLGWSREGGLDEGMKAKRRGEMERE
jgi:hypothetical protein